MKIRKNLSAISAVAMLVSNASLYDGLQVSAITVYDDYTFNVSSNVYVDESGANITLQSGDTVNVDSIEDLNYLSDYVAAGGVTEGITWTVSESFYASNYSFEFDKASGVVIATPINGGESFCIGTGINGTAYNTDAASAYGQLYSADASNGTLSVSAITYEIMPSGLEFSPIGTADYPFKGNFGGGTISGLYSASLFGYVNNANIDSLTITNSYFYAENGNAASIALESQGSQFAYCNVVDTYVTANIGNAGGLISNMTSSENESKMLGCQFVGKGCINNSLSTSSYHTGGIIAYTNYIGGAAFNAYTCLNNCDIYGGMSRTDGIAGFLGYNYIFSNSLYAGTANSTNGLSYMGGTFNDVYENESINSTQYPNGINKLSSEEIANGKAAFVMEHYHTTAYPQAANVYWSQDLTLEDSLPILTTDNTNIVYCSPDGFTNTSPHIHAPGDNEVTHNSGVDSFICENCELSFSEECNLINGICQLCDTLEKPSITTNLFGSYYMIDNYGELLWFAQAVNSGTATTEDAMLNADIAAVEGFDWTPIGSSEKPYEGSFNGLYHTISGLNVEIDGNYAGLFGSVSAANISSIGIVNSKVSANNYVGAIAGNAVQTTIIDCYAYNNTLSSTGSYCGGLIGSVASSTIEAVYTDSTLGICGESSSCNISASYHLGDDAANGTSATFEQLRNGYVAYMLQEYKGTASLWGQNLSEENSYPVFDSNYKIYCNGTSYDNNPPSEHSIENLVCNENGSHTFDCNHCEQNVTEYCNYVDGFCSVCGYFDVNTDVIVYDLAGTYILPTPAVVINGAQNLGWIDDNGDLYRCGDEVTVESGSKFTKVTLDLNTFAASARLNSDSTGIRFATQFDLVGSDYETLEIRVGTLICPNDYYTNDEIFNYNDFVKNGYIALIYDDNESVFNEVEVNGFVYDNAYFGSIVNIYPFNYGREFVGCGFVEVKYADGSVEYIYAQQKTSRSIYSLAASAYGDRVDAQTDEYVNATVGIDNVTYYSCYSNEQLDILEGFIDSVVDIKVDRTNSTISVNIPEGLENFYERPYVASADFTNKTITISGDEWNSYMEIVKNNEILFARATVLINSQRIVPGSELYTVPASYADAISNELVITFN